MTPVQAELEAFSDLALHSMELVADIKKESQDTVVLEQFPEIALLRP
jgi:hypothetical protein